MTNANNIVLDEDFDFHSFTKFGPNKENESSYLPRVIWNYLKKRCSCIVATSEDS